jgi:hypothetical protein
MKNIIRLLFSTALRSWFFNSMRKGKKTRIFMKGGTAPVLKASVAGPMILTDANKANEAIKFDWTNPNYKFTTWQAVRRMLPIFYR